MLLQKVPFQMGLLNWTMIAGGKGCNMILIIFTSNEKGVIMALVTAPEKVQESHGKVLEIHVPWRVEKNVKH